MLKPFESPFAKSLRKVPSKSPFAKSLRSPRARRAAPACATAPRAAWLGGARARRPRPPSHGHCGRRETRRTARAPPSDPRTYIHKYPILRRLQQKINLSLPGKKDRTCTSDVTSSTPRRTHKACQLSAAAQPSPQPPSDQPPSHASPSLGQHHGCTAAATRLSSQHSHTHRPSQPSHPPSRPISAQR